MSEESGALPNVALLQLVVIKKIEHGHLIANSWHTLCQHPAAVKISNK
jgi:hypothetical protein